MIETLLKLASCAVLVTFGPVQLVANFGLENRAETEAEAYIITEESEQGLKSGYSVENAPSSTVRDTLHLSERTRARLRDFRELIQHAAFLQAVMEIAPFAALIGEGPTEAVVRITQTDWNLWAENVNRFPDLQERVLLNFCLAESVHSQNTTEDKRFWRNMVESFREKE